MEREETIERTASWVETVSNEAWLKDAVENIPTMPRSIPIAFTDAERRKAIRLRRQEMEQSKEEQRCLQQPSAQLKPLEVPKKRRVTMPLHMALRSKRNAH